ncbi:unnamed protein product [Caenorhabditis angaria]|uniref:Seven TM Receptor n=1 Tax=Caenorhabditis angaria TaxID=860376 RepID=A0A9P1N8A3_9PELO|nr:unnamed protein product [Caenorhabditis angaria]
MLFSLLDVIVRPIIFSHGSIVISVSTNFSLAKDFGVFLLSIWSGFFGSFLGFFALQFIYRYLVACKSKTLKTFNDSRIILWMILPVFVGLFWGSVTYNFLQPNHTINHDIKSIVKEEFNWDTEELAYIGPNLYESSGNGEIHVNEKSLIAIVIIWSFVNISIFTVSFFAIKCYLRINSKFGGSTSLNHLQHQLFYALVTQTLIPFILMHLPVTILLCSTVFNLELGCSSSLVAVSIAFFPALDPLPVMLIIKNYRNAVANAVTIRAFTLSRKQQHSN